MQDVKIVDGMFRAWFTTYIRNVDGRKSHSALPYESTDKNISPKGTKKYP
jgi:hypothetical protein